MEGTRREYHSPTSQPSPASLSYQISPIKELILSPYPSRLTPCSLAVSGSALCRKFTRAEQPHLRRRHHDLLPYRRAVDLPPASSPLTGDAAYRLVLLHPDRNSGALARTHVQRPHYLSSSEVSLAVATGYA